MRAGQSELDLQAPDGTTLKATYFAAERPGPGVVLLHMCNSQRKAWDGLGTMLAARGIHAIRDMRWLVGFSSNLAAGDREKALEFAQKTIDALARDTQTPEDFKERIRESAQQKIQQLRATPAAPKPPAD